MDELGFAGLVFDLDEPVVIVLRHDPHPAAQRLLASIGAGWIVDPVNGDRCVRRCGRPECSVSVAPATAAHEVLQARLCVQPGCPFEAEHGSDYCREHPRARTGLKETSEADPGVSSSPAGDNDERTIPVRECKIDGCTNLANTRYDRGLFAWLCDAHIEEARSAAGERSRDVHARRAGRTLPEREDATDAAPDGAAAAAVEVGAATAAEPAVAAAAPPRSDSAALDVRPGHTGNGTPLTRLLQMLPDSALAAAVAEYSAVIQRLADELAIVEEARSLQQEHEPA